MDDLASATVADRVALAVQTIRRAWSGQAEAAIILGTGLGELVDEVAVEAALPYEQIEGFPRSTAQAHAGRLVCGRLAGTPVAVMQGRCHLYEGYGLAQVCFPVRVLAALGIRTLVVTNAAGGLNPDFSPGDVMRIDDHINLLGIAGTFRCAASFPERQPRPHTRLYDRGLAQRVEAIARRADFPLRHGVYVAVSGPTYETRAEYRAFRRLGGDCVGMSTVPEVLTAVGLGLRVLGLSTITNVACPDAPKVVSSDEVVAVAATALPRVRQILRGLFGRTGDSGTP